MKIEKTIVLIVITWSIHNNISYADFNKNTYINLNTFYSSNKMKNTFGNNVFSQKNTPGLDIALGHMYNQFIGGELGLEVNKISKKTVTIPGNETVFGVENSSINLINSNYKSKVNQNSSYVGLVLQVPFFNETNYINLLIAGSWVNMRLTSNLFEETISIFGLQYPISKNITYSFKKKKLIPMLGLLLKHKYNNKLNFQIYGRWKNLSKISLLYNESNVNNIVKLKNSIIIGIGISFII